MTTKREKTYLFELFHVDVELTAQFSLRMRESRNLGTQSTAPSSLILGRTALFLVLGCEALYFGVFAA